MSKTKTYFVIVGVAIFCFISGTIVGHIMQAHQGEMWIEDMGLDQDLEMLKLINENKTVLKRLQEHQESIEDFLGIQEHNACTS